MNLKVFGRKMRDESDSFGQGWCFLHPPPGDACLSVYREKMDQTRVRVFNVQHFQQQQKINTCLNNEGESVPCEAFFLVYKEERKL